MSLFQAMKCDECARIQGEANHWTQMTVWFDRNELDDACVGLALGPIVGNVMGTGDLTMAKKEEHDLCGQGCAVKHIAKLLKWNLPAEASQD